MYKYRNLLLVDLKTIHTVFVDAFSTYEVKIDMSIEKLEEMLKTRSFRGEYSIGCFDGDRLIGFSLSGYREIDNKKYCYDTGMGIIKEYQNKKIGKQLISTLVEYLQEQNIDYFKIGSVGKQYTGTKSLSRKWIQTKSETTVL